MRTLVFYSVFLTPKWGDRFITMANTSIDSLRIQGYKGDIVAMSDQQVGIKQADVVVTQPVPIRLTYPYDTLLMRSRIWRYVDMSKYDYILYLDADTLANKPIDDLLKHMAKINMIGAQGEGKNLNHMGHTHLGEFEEHEKTKYGKFMAYCSGVVGWPGNELGQAFIKDWEEYCDKSKSNDQTVLNSLFYRKYTGRFCPFPGVGYHCGTQPSELVIAHFYRQRCKNHYYEFFEKNILPKKSIVTPV
jgi:lipopolysaccharide biosynthesis glycosyltransferase